MTKIEKLKEWISIRQRGFQDVHDYLGLHEFEYEWDYDLESLYKYGCEGNNKSANFWSNVVIVPYDREDGKQLVVFRILV